MKAKLRTLVALAITAVAVAVAAAIAQAGDVAASKTILRVRNLSCSSCLGKINAELHRYEGMINMDADLERGIVVVQHNAPLTPTTVALVISDLGYPATVLSETLMQRDEDRASSGFGDGGCGGGCSPGALPVWKVSTWRKIYQRYFGNKSNTRQQER